MGQGHYELGRIYVDLNLQNRGIGQQAARQVFGAFPEAQEWTLGTPSKTISTPSVGGLMLAARKSQQRAMQSSFFE